MADARFAALLGPRDSASLAWVSTAIAHEIERPILGRGQGLERFLDSPYHQQMHIPVNGLQHAAEAPRRDPRRAPAGQFFQRFPSWKQRLHTDEPTQHEAMAAFPDAGPPTKQDRNEQGQIDDRDHKQTAPGKRYGRQEIVHSWVAIVSHRPFDSDFQNVIGLRGRL